MIDVQAVEAAAEDPDEAAQAITASCNAALGAEPCTTGQLEAAPASAVRVRVELSYPAVEHARVEFFVDGHANETRELTFAASDPLSERHRAIGLVIAARVLELRAEHERAQAARAEEAKAQQERAARAERMRAQQARNARARRVHFDLGALIGPGLRTGPARVGGIARASVQLSKDLPIAALLALRLATRLSSHVDDPDVLWTTPGLGLLGHIALGRSAFALELRAEALVQRIDAVAESAATGRREAGVATRYGGALGLEASALLSDHFALFAGAEASMLWPRFVLEVQGRDAGVERGTQLAALAGVRLQL